MNLIYMIMKDLLKMNLNNFKTLPCAKCQGSGKVLDQKKLGAEMRKKRMARKMSLRKMAKTLGYSAMYVSHIERGLRPWNEALIQRYDKMLEIFDKLNLLKEKNKSCPF